MKQSDANMGNMALIGAAMLAGGGMPSLGRRRRAQTPDAAASIDTPAIASKQRRDYTARQLREMAANARQGIPPAGSVADGQIREAELAGSFARASDLRDEVKERAPDLERMARAQEKAERRAKRNRKGNAEEPHE